MFTLRINSNPKEILIVRSSSKLFPVIYDELRVSFPAAQISCITTKGVDMENMKGPFNQIFYTAHCNKFYWQDLLRMRKDMRGYSCDLAVVLYNNEQGFEYLNIDMFALCAHPKEILSVNVNKAVSLLTATGMLRKAIYRLSTLFWLILNGVLTLIQLVLIVVVCLSTALIVVVKRPRMSAKSA